MAYTPWQRIRDFFCNKYDINEISLNLTAYKSINGGTDLSFYTEADPKFYFSLYEADLDGNILTRGDPVTGQTEKKVSLASHSVVFENITYGAESLKDPHTGKYVDALTKYYLIEEKALGADTTEKNFASANEKAAVKVELATDQYGVLGGTVSYAKVKEDGTVGPFGTTSEYATINNIYTDSLSVKLSGSVKLTSDIRDMADQSFTVAVSGGKLAAPQTYTVGGAGTADGAEEVTYGSEVFSFDQSDVGKNYEYTVTQTKMTQNGTDYMRSDAAFGTAGGYGADTETYRIKVAVGVDAEGKLQTDYQILRENGTSVSGGTITSGGTSESDGTFEKLDFENQYTASADILLKETTTFRAVNGTDTTVQRWLTTNGQSGFAYKVSAGESESTASSTEIAAGSSVQGDFPDTAVTDLDQSEKQTSNEKELSRTGVAYTDQKSGLGTWYYYVEQVIPDMAAGSVLKGLTYGADGIHAYIVKAEVTDDPAMNGRLKVIYSVKADKTDASWSIPSPDSPVLPYLNQYEASGTVTLEGTKTLQNRQMAAGEFRFTLRQTTAADTNAKASSLGTAKLTVQNPAAAAGIKSAAFQWKQSGTEYTDSYTSVGTYTYLAEEETPLPVGVTAEYARETLTVKVADRHDGVLTSEVTGGTAQDAAADFENSYTSSGSITISGKKTINGKSVAGYANNQFKFGLYEGDAYNVKVGEGTSDASTGIFTIIDSYTQEDMKVDGSCLKKVTKTYFLKEEQAVTSDPHYTMSSSQYWITVTLTDDQKGHISASISEIKDVTGSPQNDLVFDNTYAVNTTAAFGGTKTAQGFTLTADQDSVTDKKFHYSHFAFLLYNCDADGNTAEGAGPIDIAELTDDGTFTFDALTFRYTDGTGTNGDDAGDHYYRIVEAQPGTVYQTVADPHLPDKATECRTMDAVSDMHYSSESCIMKVAVAYDSSAGTLTATPSIVAATGSGSSNFTNIYSTGTFTIPAVSAYEAEPGTDTTYAQSKVTYSYTMIPVDANGNALTTLPAEIMSDTRNMSDRTYTPSAPVTPGKINSVSADVEFAVQTVHNTDTRYYRITQSETGANAGMSFDKGWYLVTVTTTKDPDDCTKLNSCISGIKYYAEDNTMTELPLTASIRFTNVYHAAPLTLNLQATKVLTGRYMFEEEFRFTLTGAAGTAVHGYTAYSDTKSNGAREADAVDTVIFRPDTLKGVGTYEYTLKEEASGKASVTDDQTEYKKGIQVEDDHCGNLIFASGSGVTGSGTAAGTYSFDGQKGTKAADYVNAYTSALVGGLTLHGRKTINGLAVDGTYSTEDVSVNGIYRNRENEFSFTLTETDADGNELTDSAQDTKRFTASAMADGTGAFALTIPYTQADMKTADGQSGDFSQTGRTVTMASDRASAAVYHYYRLTENAAGDGYGKSDDVYLIKVKLTDHYDGKVEASVTEIKKNGEVLAGRTDVTAAGTDLTFDNTYSAEGRIVLQGNKLTSGFSLNEPDTYVCADEFRFELYAADRNGGYNSETGLLQTTGLDSETADGTTIYKNTFTFDPISYEMDPMKKAQDLGDHYYVIRETGGTTKGMICDDREYLVRVTVSDAGHEDQTGRNLLTAVVTGVSQLTAHKFLWFEWNTANTVDFLRFTNVYQSGGIDLYASSRYVAAVGTDTDLEKLNEIQGDPKTEFSFTMNLSNADGEIVDTTGLEGLNLSETKTVSYQNNDYTAPVQMEEGGTEERALFDFLHMKENDLQVLKEWLNDLNFHSTGKFYIRIDQKIPEETAEGITYDDGHYLVEITVTEQEADERGDASAVLNAQITAVSRYDAEGVLQNTVTDTETLNAPDQLAEIMVFTNIYRAEETGLAVQAEKTTDRRSMEADEFHFTLSGAPFRTQSGGEEKSSLIGTTGAADAAEAAAVEFDRILLESIGSYTYTLIENDEGLGGVAYDGTIYTFTVEVTDDGKGALHNAITSIRRDGEELLKEAITVSDEKDAVTVLSDYIQFRNQYTAEDASVELNGTKTVNGRTAGLFRNSLFTFDLMPAEYQDGVYTAAGDAVDTALSDARDGTFKLELTFSQEDLFTETEDGSVWNRQTDHYFIITERPSGDAGYEQNHASIGITVTLTDNMDGTMKAEITDRKVQSESGASVTEDGFTFDNVYHAQGELTIAGTKTMKGIDLKKMKDGIFRFEILDEDGTVIGTASNDLDGRILFTIPCDESFIGTEKTFTMREVNDGKGNIVYDETSYQLKVTAEDAGDGKLTLKGELTSDGKTAENVAFLNVYRTKKKRHSGGEEQTSVPILSQQNGVFSPKTGDTAGAAGYLFLFLASAGGIFTVGRKRRKKKNK